MAEQGAGGAGQGAGAAPPDPLTMWRNMAAQAEEQWNTYLNQAMGTDAFAVAMGRSMEGFLGMQAQLAQTFERTLKAWNVPTRTDIVALGQRLSDIEERLDHMAALMVRDDDDDELRPRAVRRPARSSRNGSGDAEGTGA